jgi:hypothetical protein
MGILSDEPHRLQGELEVTRAELESTLGELRGAMDESLDWRSWVRRHPWPVLGAVALIGLRLGRGRWL